MQPNRIACLLVTGGLLLGLAAGSARADLVRYAWSGRVEPAWGAANPWSLSGDGFAATADDGTPFTIEVWVDVGASDLDGTLNPRHAEFVPESVVLDIGGSLAAPSSSRIWFYELPGTYDALGVLLDARVFGTELRFFAEVRVDASTFELAAPAAPDPPPVFADTVPIQFGGAVTNELVTMTRNLPVAGSLEICGGPPPATWASPTEGTSNGVGISLAGLGAPLVERFELRGPDFGADELCSNAHTVSYAVGSDWNAGFAEPVSAVLLYAKFWRGAGAGPGPVLYDFDAPFAILSGLTGASVSNGGTRLSLPESGFHDGILRFAGPLTSLAVDANSSAPAYQAMTFAVVPEPDATTGILGTIAALLFLRRWRD